MHLVKHLDHNGVAIGETIPGQTQASIGLKTPENISYQLDLNSPLATPLSCAPYATDFIFYYRDKPLFGGLHTEVSVSDIDDGYIDVAGKGWSHYFERRIWPPEDTDGYAVLGADLFTIARVLIDEVDEIGVTEDTNLSGQTTDFHIELGDTEAILSKVDSLSKMQPGFDYELTWDKHLNLYAPQMGTTVSYTLEQGRNCGPLNYRNPGIGGTMLFGTGSGVGGGNAKSYAEDLTAELAYRRLDLAKDFGVVGSPDMLTNLVTAELPRQTTPLKQLSITWLGDETIGNIFDEVWIGDTIAVVGDTGYEQVDDLMRVVGIEINPTEEDDESITFTFDDGTLSL